LIDLWINDSTYESIVARFAKRPHTLKLSAGATVKNHNVEYTFSKLLLQVYDGKALKAARPADLSLRE